MATVEILCQLLHIQKQEMIFTFKRMTISYEIQPGTNETYYLTEFKKPSYNEGCSSISICM